MSVVRSANMISASADGDVITGPFRTEEMEINNPTGGTITVTLKKNSSPNAILFQDEVPATPNGGKNYHLRLRVPAVGVLVNMSAPGATVYLYSE